MDELEASVRASWSREAIAVYGDHLQAIGDPRGELVAIDLRIDEGGGSAEVRARRIELVAAWFGDRLPPGIVRHGFVDVDATSATPDSQLALALGGPGAAYVRSVAIAGPPELLHRALTMLVEAPRPWLTRLVLRQWNEGRGPTIDHAACDRLARALPHLRELEVDGRRVLGELVHPALRRMRVSGFDAVASLVDAGEAVDIEELDFALHCHYANEHAAPVAAVRRGLLAAGRWRALRALDLSRNEPGRLEPFTLGGDVDIFAFLHERDVRRQLEILHLPSPAAPGSVMSLQLALAEMPRLRELVFHGARPALVTHPSATVRAIPR